MNRIASILFTLDTNDICVLHRLCVHTCELLLSSHLKKRWLWPQWTSLKLWDLRLCSRLTLAGCLMPTQPLSQSPFSMRQGGEEIRWRSSWVETKTGRSLSSYHRVQNRLGVGKINLLPGKTELPGLGWCAVFLCSLTARHLYASLS